MHSIVVLVSMLVEISSKQNYEAAGGSLALISSGKIVQIGVEVKLRDCNEPGGSCTWIIHRLVEGLLRRRNSGWKLSATSLLPRQTKH